MDIKSVIKKNLILNWIYKIQKIYKNKKPNFHYGEFAEDIFINRVFKNLKSGFYIDIGAYHPFKGSLTFLLFQKGWRGLNIDLSEDSIELFKIARPNDLNVHCAITNFNGETIYYQNSEINQQNSLIKRNNHQKEIKVNAFTLNDLLKKKNVTQCDYLNIDTEGNEIDIIQSINFDVIKPQLISVEDNSFDLHSENKKKIINLMNEKNYQIINIIGVTMFFTKSSSVNKFFDLINI